MDVRRLLYALLTPVLGVALSAPVAAQPADASSPVRAFVTVHYFEGVPFDDARALGPQALPELLDVLAEPALEPFWGNAVTVVGYIGSPDGIEPLLSFLQGLRGEVSIHAFRASLRVLPALGMIHGAGSDRALGPLVDFSDRDHWRTAGLGYSFARYQGEALGEVLGRTAVLGLGWSGTAAAEARLAALRPGIEPDWVDNVDEALALNARVRADGVASVFTPGR